MRQKSRNFTVMFSCKSGVSLVDLFSISRVIVFFCHLVLYFLFIGREAGINGSRLFNKPVQLYWQTSYGSWQRQVYYEISLIQFAGSPFFCRLQDPLYIVFGGWGMMHNYVVLYNLLMHFLNKQMMINLFKHTLFFFQSSKANLQTA